MANKKRMSTYKAHEIRMWITGVIVPTVATAATLATNDNVRNWCKGKAQQIKNAVKYRNK